MNGATELVLREVADGDVTAWSRLSLATLVDIKETETEYAERIFREAADSRSAARLVWCGDRAVARLRFRAWPETGRAAVWGLGPMPAVASRGLEEALVRAMEEHTRVNGARHLSVELPPVDTGPFAAAGFRVRKRRVAMRAALVRRAVECDRPMRHPRLDEAAEVDRLARLMYDAYLDTLDYDGETVDEARLEAERVLSSRYGPFLPDCSFVLEGQDGPAGVALVTREAEGVAWLCEVMVHPRYRGNGYARPLIQAAMNAALSSGYQDMGLMVTLGNVPAEGLYRRMGFEETPGTEQHHMEKEL